MIEISEYKFITNLDRAWHFVYYIPSLNFDQSPVSDSIIKAFKNGDEKHLEFWTDLACKEFNPGKNKYQAILRPLSSKETDTPLANPLDQLGLALSDILNCPYLPLFFITNELRAPLHTVKSAAQRHKLLSDSYLFKYDIAPSYIQGSKLLVIDDISTSGSTLMVICDLLAKKHSTISLDFLTIAKTSHKSGINLEFTNICNHIAKLIQT